MKIFKFASILCLSLILFSCTIDDSIIKLDGIWELSEIKQGNSEWQPFYYGMEETTVSYVNNTFNTNGIFGMESGSYILKYDIVEMFTKGYRLYFKIEYCTDDLLQVEVLSRGYSCKFKKIIN